MGKISWAYKPSATANLSRAKCKKMEQWTMTITTKNNKPEEASNFPTTSMDPNKANNPVWVELTGKEHKKSKTNTTMPEPGDI